MASGVLETSQVQMLGPRPREDYSMARDETEVHGVHFNLGMKSLSSLT